MKKESDIPLDWFVCPVTKERLVYKDDRLISSFGAFPRIADYGYWDFIPYGLRDLNRPEWRAWEILQKNAMVPYTLHPERNLGVGKRKDFLDFAAFAGFSGVVLDVGVGPQKIPTHMEYCSRDDVFFVGIDPLAGEQPREFAFVQGLAEFLPFRDRLFDQVLFVTTLDHFVDPRPALKDAKRVVKKGGFISVWIGEKDRNAPQGASADWYEKLIVPDGADDPFHYKRLTAHDFLEHLADTGLMVAERETITIDPWRQNHFFRLCEAEDR